MSTASAQFLVGYYGSSRILYWFSPRVRQMAGTPPPLTHTHLHMGLCQTCHPGTTQVREMVRSWRMLYVCKAQGGDELIIPLFEERHIWYLHMRILQLAREERIPILGNHGQRDMLSMEVKRHHGQGDMLSMEVKRHQSRGHAVYGREETPWSRGHAVYGSEGTVWCLMQSLPR